MLSVIIPTRNRVKLLSKTLDSIQKQNLAATSFEVIVVDNGSTDETKSVVELYTNRFPYVKYIYEDRPGLHQGRHAGMRAAHGDVLVFADDDIEAFPTWLETIHQCFMDPKVGMVGGKNIPEYETTPPGWINDLWEKTHDGKFSTHYSLLDLGDKPHEIDPDFVFGCNFSIRKELLVDIGGFHPDGMPEKLLRFRGDGETFVGRKIKEQGFKTIYHPDASVRHWVPTSRMTRDYIRKRSYMSGVSQSYTDTRTNGGPPKKTFVEATITFLKRQLQVFRLDSLRGDILKSYFAGYDFHQQEMRKDPELVSWVLKDTYIE